MLPHSEGFPHKVVHVTLRASSTVKVHKIVGSFQPAVAKSSKFMIVLTGRRCDYVSDDISVQLAVSVRHNRSDDGHTVVLQALGCLRDEPPPAAEP